MRLLRLEGGYWKEGSTVRNIGSVRPWTHTLGGPGSDMSFISGRIKITLSSTGIWDDPGRHKREKPRLNSVAKAWTSLYFENNPIQSAYAGKDQHGVLSRTLFNNYHMNCSWQCVIPCVSASTFTPSVFLNYFKTGSLSFPEPGAQWLPQRFLCLQSGITGTMTAPQMPLSPVWNHRD